jgi:hypothetical protein
MADPTTDPDDYELHQVERDELHEEWVWVWNEKLKKDIEGRRPALLFEYKGNSVCCETLYADDRYLENRHKPLLAGKISVIRPDGNFIIGETSVQVTKRTEYCGGITKESLPKNVAVFVRYSKEADEKSKATNESCEATDKNSEGTNEPEKTITAIRITRGDKLVFMNSWYRHQLGIDADLIKQGISVMDTPRIPLRVRGPRSTGQAMWWQLRACARHPQIAVVMSTVLAVVGTGLGVVGLAAIIKELPQVESIKDIKNISGFDRVWLSVAAVGFIIFVLGFRPLCLRAKQSLPDAK